MALKKKKDRERAVQKADRIRFSEVKNRMVQKMRVIREKAERIKADRIAKWEKGQLEKRMDLLAKERANDAELKASLN